MKLLLTGGGTAGSVSPLLAVYSTLLRRGFGGQGLQQIKNGLSESEVLWLGTKNGPERKMVEDCGVEFKPIFSGKLRRYFDLRNLIDIFKIGLGFLQSFFIILEFKPDIILSAGSFVSVPVVWAGWIWGKKILIHQQDVGSGLANKLMAPFVTKITVTFEESLKHFPRKKTIWTGNPVRQEILEGERERAIERFGLERRVPTILVMGGGTGSVAINEIVHESLSELTEFCQIVHLTGGRYNNQEIIPKIQSPNTNNQKITNNQISNSKKFQASSIKHQASSPYHQVDFLNVREMADAYAVADIVVSRCGMSSMTELSALAKPTIFIPLGDTHQEDNAKMILEKEAGIVIWRGELTKEKLIKEVKGMLDKKKIYEDNISNLIKSGAISIANEIWRLQKGNKDKSIKLLKNTA